MTVGHRVGDAVTHQLVVLDQPVVRILREGQRRQVQGVDDALAEQRQRRRLGAQCRQVVAEQIVADDVVRAGGELREAGQRPVALETTLDAQLAPVADGADLVDGAVWAGLQVEQQRVGEQHFGAWSGGWRGGLGHPGRRAGLRLAALASRGS